MFVIWSRMDGRRGGYEGRNFRIRFWLKQYNLVRELSGFFFLPRCWQPCISLYNIQIRCVCVAPLDPAMEIEGQIQTLANGKWVKIIPLTICNATQITTPEAILYEIIQIWPKWVSSYIVFTNSVFVFQEEVKVMLTVPRCPHGTWRESIFLVDMLSLMKGEGGYLRR